MLDALLALLLLLFAWPLVLFPALMRWLVKPQPPQPPPSDAELPPLTLIICALNEERVIRAKMENCLDLDYPPGKLSIVVINDGSSDSTAAIVREYAGRGIQLIDHPARRGKVTNLNDAAPAAATPLVAFSDANVLYEPKALRHLAARFRDPKTGGATGRVVLVNTSEEFRQAEQSYYSLEWAIHDASTRIYSMAGCDGAMYVLRRELFRVCPGDTLIEDFVQALAVVRQGCRMVFVPEAVAWEEGPRSLGEEYRRKVRIAAGAAQALLRGNGWPAGAPLRFWWLWLSHKFLRWLAPFTALAALALAAINPARPLSQAVLVAGAAVVLAALVRALTGWRHPLVNAPFYLLFGLAAGLAGLIKGAAGRQSVLWSKAGR
jgi:poly-beta-1,6-N-acetyl-D-glucosamine synthase